MATNATATNPFRASALPAAHPMDTSQLYLTLLSLVQEGEAAEVEDSRHIIAVPVLRRLLSAIHFRDSNTLKHSRRVGLISVGIANRLGWEEDDLRVIEIAALLHDIGKIGVPDHILRKPGKLSPDEAEFIAVYHRVAVSLLQACRIHPSVTEIISQSHNVEEEHLHGCNTLSLGARILAVADAYDSLTTRQCYRAPYDRWEALQILEEQSGKQFDRNVVAALGRWLDTPDAAALVDERAAEVSIHVNAPVDSETRMGATQLCQIVNHLYLLESLYEAFYVIDSNRRIAIWSSGASRLFNRSAYDTLWKKWNRNLLVKFAANTDPVETVFMSGQSVCHALTVSAKKDEFVDVDVQTIPILTPQGDVSGVVELICNCKESKRHRGQFRSLQMAATRDALTGVLNRGELERRLAETHGEFTTGQTGPYSIVFLDLDHFKSINDRLTHVVGDRVLVDCSRLIQDELYSGELIGRYGGEEFVIVCPDTTGQAALERAERLRRTISSSRFADRDDLRVTVSIGIAEAQPGESLESVITRADQSLYEAKHQGRNRSCLSQRRAESAQAESSGTSTSDRLQHTASFLTYVAPEMLHLKVTGFVEEFRAKILKVSPKDVTLQVGSGGLFTNWTQNAQHRIPVKLHLEIHEAPQELTSKSGRRLKLLVTLEPVGRCNDHERFHERSAQLVDALKSYLMAD